MLRELRKDSPKEVSGEHSLRPADLSVNPRKEFEHRFFMFELLRAQEHDAVTGNYKVRGPRQEYPPEEGALCPRYGQQRYHSHNSIHEDICVPREMGLIYDAEQD
jgi:hypothetical protein